MMTDREEHAEAFTCSLFNISHGQPGEERNFSIKSVISLSLILSLSVLAGGWEGWTITNIAGKTHINHSNYTAALQTMQSTTRRDNINTYLFLHQVHLGPTPIKVVVFFIDTKLLFFLFGGKFGISGRWFRVVPPKSLPISPSLSRKIQTKILISLLPSSIYIHHHKVLFEMKLMSLLLNCHVFNLLSVWRTFLFLWIKTKLFRDVTSLQKANTCMYIWQ